MGLCCRSGEELPYLPLYWFQILVGIRITWSLEILKTPSSYIRPSRTLKELNMFSSLADVDDFTDAASFIVSFEIEPLITRWRQSSFLEENSPFMC